MQQLLGSGIELPPSVQVSYVDAILGCSKKVTTIDGPVDLTIPAGTQPGTTLLIRGRGAPSCTERDNERGNQMVKVKVTIPKKPSSEERRLVEELKQLEGAGSNGRIKVGPFSL